MLAAKVYSCFSVQDKVCYFDIVAASSLEEVIALLSAIAHTDVCVLTEEVVNAAIEVGLLLSRRIPSTV